MTKSFNKIEREYKDIDTSVLFDTEYLFKKTTKMVLSFYTAASFWGLSDILNEKIDVTVPRGYNPRIDKKNINIKQRTINKYDSGIVSFRFEGKDIKVYSPERTIVEILKKSGSKPKENEISMFIKFFKDFNYDRKKLETFADEFNVSKEIGIIKSMVDYGF